LDATETAAQTHALLRAQSGFAINQLAAEYRALRASVLRLWVDACSPESPDFDDIVRFNEAIDQAIAESIGFFSAQIDQARNPLARDAGARHAQSTPDDSNDGNVPRGPQRRRESLGRGIGADKQWCSHEGPVERPGRAQSNETGFAHQVIPAEAASLGLGLYIAREIATAHGGNIEARSDPTETVFAANLPRHPTSA